MSRLLALLFTTAALTCEPTPHPVTCQSGPNRSKDESCAEDLRECVVLLWQLCELDSGCEPNLPEAVPRRPATTPL